MMDKMVRYDSLDFLKGIACVAVVLIHYPFTGDALPPMFSNCVRASMRFAVPVFFAISGFFSVMDDGSPVVSNKIRSKIAHVLKIYLFSGLFYLVFDALLFRAAFPRYLSSRLTISRAVKLILVSVPFFRAHLWFLISLLACYATLYVFRVNYRAWLALAASVALMALFLMMQEFRVIPSRVLGRFGGMSVFNNYAFRALPFFLFGMACRSLLPGIRRMNVSNAVLVLFSLLGMVVAILERLYFNESQFYIGTNATFALMFVWALRCPARRNGFLVYVGRHLSMFVYILHIAVGITFIKVVGRMTPMNSLAMQFLTPIAIIIFTLAVSYVVDRSYKAC